jgi:hypothetical protein
MALRPDFYTVETIAAQVAKSPSYVRGRISLSELISAAQTAFYEGKLTIAHALQIAKLQPQDQEKALMECFPGHHSTSSILKDRKAEAVSVRELREWIEREIHLDLKKTPFDTEDTSLVPAAGACSACQKRTGNNPLLFPEIKNRSLCTDPTCHQAKIQALVQLRVAPLVKEGKKPVHISESPSWQVPTHPGRGHRGRPQSGNGHARLHGREVQDTPAILPLRNFARGKRAAPKACARGPSSKGGSFAHSAGCPRETSGRIGTRRL